MKLPLPPMLFLACLVTGWAAGRIHPLPLPWGGGMSAPAWALVILAPSLALWAVLTFRRHHTTPEPNGTPTAMVASGPYRFTRNPMYLGLVTLLTGLAFLADSAWMLLLAPVLMLLLDRIVIAREEVRLAGLFGDSYRAYRSRVRRWI
jgi:protein-S-isoprenylcysteine O-methyltransferase Ste14